jgi:N-acetylglucosamine-6-sulfatase
MKKALVVLAFALFTPFTATSQTPVKPNILVIQIDDWDVASLKVLLDAGLLPKLKQHVVDVSFDFTASYAVGTYGAVTRAGFLTGQYPHNHKEIGGEPLLGEPAKFNQNSTVATWVRAAGYTTGYVGRYTTGYGLGSPEAERFIPPGWDYWGVPIDPSTWSMYRYRMNIGGTVYDFSPYNAYQTDTFTWYAGEVLKAAPTTKPFFLVVAPVVFNREMWPGPDITNECPDPSVPYIGGNYWGVTQRPAERHRGLIFGNPAFALPQPPSFNEADVSDKPLWVQQNPLLTPEDMDCRQKSYWRRLESMLAVDDMVGYLVDILQAKGALENTVIVFTADNGYMNGEHRFSEKTPAYEESIRVPLFIRPRTPLVRTPINRLVLNTDLAPTIAQFAGATPTIAVDGRSLVPLMQNPAMAWRKVALFQHLLPTQSAPVGSPPHYFALRIEEALPFKFVHYPTVTQGLNGELYDLAADPDELLSLYTDPAHESQIAGLKSWVNALKTCKGAGVCAFYENMFSMPK